MLRIPFITAYTMYTCKFFVQGLKDFVGVCRNKCISIHSGCDAT